jgi:hypothetical protein
MDMTRIAARTTVASGLIAAIGIGFLIAMFTAFAVGAGDTARVVGRINDVCVLVSYLLCVPSVIAMATILRPRGAVVNALLAGLGLGSIAAIVVLQWLLVSEALTFEEQIGPVSVAIWGLGAWFILTGSLGSRSGSLPRGGRMGILAATYVGYPIWALWFGRILRSERASETGGKAPMGADVALDR